MKIFKPNSPIVVIKNYIENGRNVFVTGGAGTGKSYILKKLKEHYGDCLHITSTTGISALNVNGQTVHSWSGIGFVNDPRKDFDSKTEKAFFKIKKNNEKLYQKIFDAKMLAIDEISMLDNVTFDFISEVCKKIRNNDKPFGGIQILLFGDFFQLPPVSKDIGYDFCFYSKTWEELDLKSVILEDIYRQDDPIYIDALNNIRLGKVVQKDTDLFDQRVKESIGVDKENITHIYGTNKEANERNRECFKKLKTPIKTYSSRDVFIKYETNSETGVVNQKEIDIRYCNAYGKPVEGIYDKKQEDLIKDFNNECRTPQSLYLRVGARVMLTRNNKDLKLANGSCGEVVELTDSVIMVKFDKQDFPVSVPKVTFDYYYEDRVVIQRYQYPLTLAYAMTIHKSQGLTIDKIVVNFDKIFDHGQGYVALSRTRTLGGLILDSYNPELITASEDVENFYNVLRKKECFTKLDYPESKLKRLDFEARLEATMNNKVLMDEKIEHIKKNLNKDIWIDYLEKKQGWQVVRRKIKPEIIDLGINLDEYKPLEYRRIFSDKYYIVSHCYLRSDEREFRPEMLEIVNMGLPDLDFSYTKENGEEVTCNVSKEIEQKNISVRKVTKEISLIETKADTPVELEENFVEFDDDTTGVTYEGLFAPYLKSASKITITDSFIRNTYQILNLKEFISMVANNKTGNDTININLETSRDENDKAQQEKFLNDIVTYFSKKGIDFSYDFNASHARSIETDTGWKIVLDRGLDIYKKCERNIDLQQITKFQERRTCRDFYVFYKKKV